MKIRIAEHRFRSGESSTGVPVDAGFVDIDIRIALRQLFHGGDLVGQGVVAHIAVVRIVEGL